MPESLSHTQRRIRIIDRIHSICREFRSLHGSEPCLEAYEQRLLIRFGQELPAAAVAWTVLIVDCLRNSRPFDARNYLPPEV